MKEARVVGYNCGWDGRQRVNRRWKEKQTHKSNHRETSPLDVGTLELPNIDIDRYIRSQWMTSRRSIPLDRAWSIVRKMTIYRYRILSIPTKGGRDPPVYVTQQLRRQTCNVARFFLPFRHHLSVPIERQEVIQYPEYLRKLSELPIQMAAWSNIPGNNDYLGGGVADRTLITLICKKFDKGRNRARFQAVNR
jgi:hypothetical protein